MPSALKPKALPHRNPGYESAVKAGFPSTLAWTRYRLPRNAGEPSSLCPISAAWSVTRAQSEHSCPLCALALEEGPIFPPQVGQEQVLEWPSGALRNPFEFGEIVGVATPMQFQESVISHLPLRGAMVGQDLLLEETVGVKRVVNLFGKLLTNGKSNLMVRTVGFKLFNHFISFAGLTCYSDIQVAIAARRGYARSYRRGSIFLLGGPVLP